jgi:hypothetical protein
VARARDALRELEARRDADAAHEAGDVELEEESWGDGNPQPKTTVVHTERNDLPDDLSRAR